MMLPALKASKRRIRKLKDTVRALKKIDVGTGTHRSSLMRGAIVCLESLVDDLEAEYVVAVAGTSPGWL